MPIVVLDILATGVCFKFEEKFGGGFTFDSKEIIRYAKEGCTSSAFIFMLTEKKTDFRKSSNSGLVTGSS